MAKNRLKYFQLEPAAFLTDIDFQMMDAEQRGVYCSLLFYLYANDGKIELPNSSDITLLSDNTSRLALISGCTRAGKEWSDLWQKIAHKFELSDGFLSHSRVSEEIQRANSLRESKSKAGKKGMSKRWDDNNADNTDITKGSKVKESKEEKKITKKDSDNPDGLPARVSDFEEVRKKYPGTKRGSETEFKNFKKHKDWKEVLPLLAGIIEKQIEQRKAFADAGAFVPEWKHFRTWINQRCWEEELGSPQSAKDGTSGIKACVVCRSTQNCKYQNNARGQPVHLCSECLKALGRIKVRSFGSLEISRIESLVLKGKASRDG